MYINSKIQPTGHFEVDDTIFRFDGGWVMRCVYPEEVDGIFEMLSHVDAASKGMYTSRVLEPDFKATYKGIAEKSLTGRRYAAIALTNNRNLFSGLCSFEQSGRDLDSNKVFIQAAKDRGICIAQDGIIELGHLWALKSSLNLITSDDTVIQGGFQWLAMQARLELLNQMNIFSERYEKGKTAMQGVLFINPENKKAVDVMGKCMEIGAVDFGVLPVKNKYKSDSGKSCVERHVAFIPDIAKSLCLVKQKTGRNS